jgi:hypothetical protein
MWAADNKPMVLTDVAAYNRDVTFIPLAVSTPGARAPRRKFGCPLFFGTGRGGT